MSYQVLARKWRPNTFSEVVGQEHILTILSNALSLGRVHHAYLFSGTRGVGKTSIARILAKGLNCESGITATPCGVCHNCLDIEQGRFIDLLEIDAASRTKVEDTREILDNIQYLPTKGRFKVYLIDEVHMLSRSSFNALLKTLEEPPEHVKFLLATTDPQKLPITILSRCLHLHLNVLDASLISGQLSKILQIEQINSEPKAIGLLAKAANGSMRDALSLTDQAIALGNGQIDENSVTVMLGALDQNIFFSLIEALHHADGNALMQQIEMAAKQGANWDNLLAESIALLHQIALLQVVPTALGNYSDSEERIRFLAQYMAPNDVQLFYQILLTGRRDLALSPDKKMGTEMSFLRALAFMPKADADIAQPKPVSTKEPVTQKRAQVLRSESDETNKPVNSQTEKVATAHAEQTAITPEQQENIAHTAPMLPEQSAANDEMPASTKSILEMRMKLMQGEHHAKKSETVETVQPFHQKAKTELTKLNNRLTASNLKKEGRADPNTVTFHEYDEQQTDSCDEDELITAENYQWQATRVIESKNELKIDAQSLLSSENNQKTPEMELQLFEELAQQDEWANEIRHLTIAPLVKQIAMNAFIVPQSDEIIVLHVRSAIRHLTKTTNNIKKLSDAMSAYRYRNITLQVVIDDEQREKTPLEKVDILYQQKLDEVTQKIKQDDKVAMICQFFEAQIEEASIRPV